MNDDEGARKRVRQLLLSGDNTLKHRDDAASRAKARTRFEEALAVAEEAGLGDEIVQIIRRRLEPAGLADAV